MILGIVGGIGSGKSTVARLLVELGAQAVDADAIARQVVEQPEIRRQLRERFGDGVFSPGGEIDRAALAARVFADPRELSALNALVHPAVQSRILETLAVHRRQGPGGAAGSSAPSSEAEVWRRLAQSVLVLDVSLLATSPLLSECDAVLFVAARDEVRRERCRRRGWAEGELERRERHQPALAAKAALARWTIDNSGSLDETRRQLIEVLQSAAREREEVR
jgi:dephospho-CoA kinase